MSQGGNILYAKRDSSFGNKNSQRPPYNLTILLYSNKEEE
jgi:hypothetical protein